MNDTVQANPPVPLVMEFAVEIPDFMELERGTNTRDDQTYDHTGSSVGSDDG